jgi:flagellar biosynthesis protein FlhF
MRLKTFTANTMSEAMARVREALGEDAIIVSAEEVDGGTQVLAAIESEEPAMLSDDEASDAIHMALVNHGIVPRIAERLVRAAASLGIDNDVRALAAALDSSYRFAPITAGRIALVGPPGAGKTVTCAKLATRAVLAGHAVQVVTADTVRAGAVEQLAALTRILGLDLYGAEQPDELDTILAESPPDALVIIDMPGVNPYLEHELDEVAAFVRAAPVEPVLVLPAGGDVYDMVEMARGFARLGCQRFIPTRVDMAHRLGGLVAIADAAKLAFAEVGISASVADGLRPLSAVGLARLLLPAPEPAPRAEAPAATAAEPALEPVRVAS